LGGWATPSVVKISFFRVDSRKYYIAHRKKSLKFNGDRKQIQLLMCFETA